VFKAFALTLSGRTSVFSLPENLMQALSARNSEKKLKVFSAKLGDFGDARRLFFSAE